MIKNKQFRWFDELDIDDTSKAKSSTDNAKPFRKINPNERFEIRFLSDPPEALKHWVPQQSPLFKKGNAMNSNCPVCDDIRRINISRIQNFVDSLDDSILSNAIKQTLQNLDAKKDIDSTDKYTPVAGKHIGLLNKKDLTGGSGGLYPAETVLAMKAKKHQLTTKFNLTVKYIRDNIMPILHRYTLHEVDAFSALFAKFRTEPDYSVVLTVQDNQVFKVTPEMMILMVVKLYEEDKIK
jgi:hypothetical protein